MPSTCLPASSENPVGGRWREPYARVPAVPRCPWASTHLVTWPLSCGQQVPTSCQTQDAYHPRKVERERQHRRPAMETGKALWCRDPEAGYQWGNMLLCPCLLFWPLLFLFLLPRRTLNIMGPPNVALINWLQFTSGGFVLSTWLEKWEVRGGSQCTDSPMVPAVMAVTDHSQIWCQHLSFRGWLPLSGGFFYYLKKSKWADLTKSGNSLWLDSISQYRYLWILFFHLIVLQRFACLRF